MASYRFSAVTLAVAALFSPIALGGTASADTRPSSTLTLSVRPIVGAASTVVLECGPAGGSHPNPDMACDEIARVGGDLNSLADKEGEYCTMEYQPVTVSAVGRWRCRDVTWLRTYGNLCLMRVDTGSVFAF